jgi:hypothetical protein
MKVPLRKESSLSHSYSEIASLLFLVFLSSVVLQAQNKNENGQKSLVRPQSIHYSCVFVVIFSSPPEFHLFSCCRLEP